MSIDDYPGKDKGAVSLLYRNQDTLFPEFQGRDLKTLYPEIQFQNLALDGATTIHVLHEQLGRIKAPRDQRTLFTLTAGGNDILLGQDANAIVNRLEIIVNKIIREYPHCDLIIGTIYDPTDGVKDLFEDGRDMTREYEILTIVNETIRQFGKHSNVSVIDIYSHFLGHGSHCKDSNNPYYKPEDPSLWYVLTIEPNIRGAHEIRRLFWKALHPESASMKAKSTFKELRERLSSFQITQAANRTFDLSLTEEELEKELMSDHGSNRLLERFSDKEVVSALKDYKVWDLLAEKGYKNPRLLIRSIDPFRQTVKILDDASSPEDEEHTLCELRIFDAHLKGPCPTNNEVIEVDALVIDWLVFQNPRAKFTQERQRLPGQKFPGLGIMARCMTAILDLAKQTGKEAVINIPEYYHNAVLYKPAFCFFSPFVEGRFQALQEFLKNLSLADASHAVTNGLVWNETKNELFTWKPHEQMLGISPKIKTYFESDTYKNQVREAKEQSKFSLVK